MEGGEHGGELLLLAAHGELASSRTGRGVFAKSYFSQGDFVVEYRGKLISFEEAERRKRTYPQRCTAFMFDFYWKEKIWWIDAAQEDGSLGRLVNDDHSHPNCKMKRIMLEAKPHLCLFASRDIQPGEEITYDYGGSDCPWRTQHTLIWMLSNTHYSWGPQQPSNSNHYYFLCFLQTEKQLSKAKSSDPHLSRSVEMTPESPPVLVIQYALSMANVCPHCDTIALMSHLSQDISLSITLTKTAPNTDSAISMVQLEAIFITKEHGPPTCKCPAHMNIVPVQSRPTSGGREVEALVWSTSSEMSLPQPVPDCLG
ncbi:hypothetical protein WMY93_032777 [Mugilogobius chulae]|uniref:SET domain-containing protein n=1 Tax=Mugilogobius chulae TaxID=88201 RepID=A0AAW0MUP2_9GOBI